MIRGPGKTCAEQKRLKDVDAKDQQMRKRIAAAKTAAELREIANKLRANLLVVERHDVQVGFSIARMKGEIRLLSKARENQKRTIRVLAGEVYRGSAEATADELCRQYDPRDLPF